MAKENVEVVREQFEAVNRRDWKRAMELYDEDVVLVVDPSTSLNPGTHTGREAVGEWFGDWMGTFDEIHFDWVDFKDGGERIALWARHTAAGRGSGVPVENELFYTYDVRDGLITRVEFLPSWEAALAAL